MYDLYLTRTLKHAELVRNKVGGAAAKPFTIQLLTYFGADGDSAQHKRAIKNSDVFVYNGHSYIGYGPLDPSNFSASDFPSTYQVLVVNGCVSFNYYDHYFQLKPGGTKTLDTITNGLESWVNGSGATGSSDSQPVALTNSRPVRRGFPSLIAAPTAGPSRSRTSLCSVHARLSAAGPR